MSWIRCLLCEQETQLNELLCLWCRREMAKLTYSRTEPAEGLGELQLHAAAAYENSWARYIRLAKVQNGQQLQSPMRVPLQAVVRHWAVELKRHRIDAVTWVPSQTWRELAGFSLSRWLAHEMAAALGVPMLGARMQKTQGFWAPMQKSQTKLRRLETSFRLKKPRTWRPLGAHVLLVDDVCTSGASLRACARLLEDAGLVCERSWVLARTPLKIGKRAHAPAEQIRRN